MTTVLTVSQTQVATPGVAVEPANATGRLAPLFAGIWLFFLLNPLLEGWSRRDELRGVAGIVCTLAFAALYMSLWIRARADRHALLDPPPLSWTCLLYTSDAADE